MFPELLKIGPLSIKTYGFFVAVGFLAGMNYARILARRQSINPEIVLDLSLYIIVSGLIGARIFYVLLNWDFYKKNLLEIFFIWSGGLVLYGGVIFAFMTSALYVYFKKLNFFVLSDIFAPAFFLGLAIGRIGCFSAGCCYGKPTSLPWGVVFTNPDSLVAPSALGLKLHPTQLYESLFSFLLFLGLNFYYKYKKFSGEIFFSSLIFYSIWRFFIEFIRWDDRGQKILGLFPSQFISILMCIFSIFALVYLIRRNINEKRNSS